MTKERTERTLLPAAIGYAATAAAVIVVPIILLPPAIRSEWFWHRVAWAEFLVLLCWFTAGLQIAVFIPGHWSPGARTAIVPALFIYVIAYAGLSLAAMFLVSYLPNNDPFHRWHLAAQTLLALALILIVVSLSFARQGARIDTTDSLGLPSPRDLAHALLATEQALKATSAGPLHQRELFEAVRAIALLREKLEYSHLADGIRANRETYEAVARGVGDLAARSVQFQAQNDLGIHDIVLQCRQMCVLIASLAAACGKTGSV